MALSIQSSVAAYLDEADALLSAAAGDGGAANRALLRNVLARAGQCLLQLEVDDAADAADPMEGWRAWIDGEQTRLSMEDSYSESKFGNLTIHNSRFNVQCSQLKLIKSLVRDCERVNSHSQFELQASNVNVQFYTNPYY